MNIKQLLENPETQDLIEKLCKTQDAIELNQQSITELQNKNSALKEQMNNLKEALIGRLDLS